MLSLFPYLLSFQLVSPLLLRLVLGLIFLFWAKKKFNKLEKDNKDKTLIVVDLAIGVLLVIGLWTQLASLVAAISLAIHIILKIKQKAFLTDGINYYLILLIISLSLLFTGPGILAFDLPL